MCDDTSVLTDLANNELVNKLMENLMVGMIGLVYRRMKSTRSST